MPTQPFRRPSRELAPTERLVRAINNIDKRLEEVRDHHQPIPLSAHRARRILQDALQRCREPAIHAISPPSLDSSAQAGTLSNAYRLRRGPVERHEALPGLSVPASGPRGLGSCLQHPETAALPPRQWNCDLHAGERKRMTYDRTGGATRNRPKMASAMLLTVALVFGVSATVASFL